MNLKNKGSKLLYLILFCFLSFVAGGINGFLGTGGGIIFVFILSFLTKNDKKDNFATTLCATLIISLLGSVAYFQRSSVDFKLTGIILLPSVLGGALGAVIMDKIHTRALNFIFSILIIFSGACLFFR